ncbi:FAD-binding oxidoreductase, partial [Burkholderia cenocepacia]|nr:FAD-binding oxidoreductase [Burkholderia cenocepacia]
MISKEAIKRGYNRGNYVVGAHTPPPYALNLPATGGAPVEAGMQRAPVTVSPQQVDALRAVADEVLVQPADVVAWTRDWWAASMVA